MLHNDSLNKGVRIFVATAVSLVLAQFIESAPELHWVLQVQPLIIKQN